MIEINPAKWTAKEREQFLDKGFREVRDGETPVCSTFIRPLDYDNDLSRGTLKFNAEWHNYSYHSVVIPDGTKVRRCNFAQTLPGTLAITGANLEFDECNLVNNALDSSWKVTNCNTAQAWLVRVPVEGRGESERRQFICSHPSELKGNEKEPETIVKRRDF